ncbi:MAG: hypothetical protein ACOYMN_21435 [Roseimicrobium sp.]
MILEFHPFVLDDVRVAALSYESNSPAMADAFIAEVSARLGKVQSDPESFPFCGPNTSFRRAKLWRFPQSIVFRVEADVVYVSLIAQAITSELQKSISKTQRIPLRFASQRETRLPIGPNDAATTENGAAQPPALEPA